MWNPKPVLSRFFAALTFCLLCAVLDPAHAANVTPELRCRRTIAGAVDRWLARVTSLHQRCEGMIVDGLLDSATDCIDGSIVQPALLDAEAEVRAAVDGGCDGVNWGLLSFPGPCASQGGAFGSGSVSDCVDTIGRQALGDLLALWYPHGVALARGNEAACMKGIPKKAAKMLTREVGTRLECLLGVEGGDVVSTVDCRAQMQPYDNGTGDSSIDREIYRARRQWTGGMPRACASADFQTLGYGTICPNTTGAGAGLIDLQSCVAAASRQKVALLLDLVFPSTPVCGNGIPQEGEACDEGAQNSDTLADACRSDCSLPVCGDHTTDPGNSESCDDGNSVNLDGCTTNCVKEVCGDGLVNNLPGETCEDRNSNANDRCTNTCNDALCGDGIVCSDPACTSGPGGGVERCDLGAQNSSSGLCHPDCSGYARTCTLTIGVSNSVRIGALTYEIGYKDVVGEFLGTGGAVLCTSVVTGGLVSFFDNETKKIVKESLIIDAGIQAPAAIAKCTWATNATTIAGGAFPVTVQVTADPDLNDVAANVGVTSVECQP